MAWRGDRSSLKGGGSNSKTNVERMICSNWISANESVSKGRGDSVVFITLLFRDRGGKHKEGFDIFR